MTRGHGVDCSPNNLLSHPLVSPVNLGSLGGLCPLLIVSFLVLEPYETIEADFQTGGGGELLRDEVGCRIILFEDLLTE
jgi:hypothetical protein